MSILKSKPYNIVLEPNFEVTEEILLTCSIYSVQVTLFKHPVLYIYSVDCRWPIRFQMILLTLFIIYTCLFVTLWNKFCSFLLERAKYLSACDFFVAQFDRKFADGIP